MDNTRQSVVDIVFARWRSQILYAGVKLGVFEAIGSGSKRAADLAAELELDATLLYRLLRALSSLQLLGEDKQQRFSLTDSGAFLRADHPQTLRGVALLEESPEHNAVWKYLCDMVRDGKQDGFVREYGHPIFVHAAEESGYCDVFNDAMSSYSSGETAMVLEALANCDLSSINHACDVGGGRGHLLCSLLARHPAMRGTVYELETTLVDKSLLWADKLGVADRCQYTPGDMFKQVPAADAYFLKHILHDWNDAECVQILGNMHQVAPAGARAFVAEFVVPGPDTPHFAKLFDIHMLCATSGRERTEEEYAGLFRDAGWEYVQAWHPGAKSMSVLEAVKPASG